MAKEISQPLPLVVVQAEQVVTDKIINELKEDAICGCPSCKGRARFAIDWLLYPDTQKQGFTEDLMDMLLKEHKDKKFKEKNL